MILEFTKYHYEFIAADTVEEINRTLAMRELTSAGYMVYYQPFSHNGKIVVILGKSEKVTDSRK